MSDDNHVRLGDLAVALKLITTEQLDSALHSQSEGAKSGKRESLGAILIRHGMISEGQLKLLLKWEPTANYKCPECSKELEKPEELSSKLPVCPDCKKTGIVFIPPDTEAAAGTVTIEEEIASMEGIDPDLMSEAHKISGVEYHFIKPLGTGAMGEVYLAWDSVLHRQVAVKRMLPGRMFNEKARIRFEREARNAAALVHPNIVTVHAVDFTPGEYSIVMEYVDGVPLDELIEGETLSNQRIAEIMRDVAGAMQHAHERHVVHRDLKPANIMVKEEGAVKVADFGLAKNLITDPKVSMDNAIAGSPAYMSPEHFAGAEHVCPSSDIYSLGSILYELLTGQLPHRSANMASLANEVCNIEPQAIRELKQDADPALETICMKCLEKKPEDRFAAARDLADELERYLKEEDIRIHPRRKRSSGLPARLLGSKLLWAVIVLLIIAITTSVLIKRNNSYPDPVDRKAIAKRNYDECIKAARSFETAEEWEKAAEEYSKAYEISPTREAKDKNAACLHKSFLIKAETAEQSGYLDKAIDNYGKAVSYVDDMSTNRKKQFVELYKKIDDAQAKGDYDTALVYCSKANEFADETRKARLDKKKAIIQTAKKLQKFSEVYTKIETAEANGDLKTALSLCEQARGIADGADAEKLTKKEKKIQATLNVSNFRKWYEKGLLAEGKKDYGAALTYYGEAEKYAVGDEKKDLEEKIAETVSAKAKHEAEIEATDRKERFDDWYTKGELAEARADYLAALTSYSNAMKYADDADAERAKTSVARIETELDYQNNLAEGKSFVEKREWLKAKEALEKVLTIKKDDEQARALMVKVKGNLEKSGEEVTTSEGLFRQMERIVVSARLKTGDELDIFILDTNGKGITNLTKELPGDASAPRISPDGKQIGFTIRTSDTLSELWVLGSSGTRSVKQIGGGVLMDWYDNDTLLYKSPAGTGKSEVWTVDTDGENSSCLIPSPFMGQPELDSIRMSPNGRKLACSWGKSGSKASRNVYIVYANGTGGEVFYQDRDNRRFDGNVVWSGAGTRIFWQQAASRGTKYSVYYKGLRGDKATSMRKPRSNFNLYSCSPRTEYLLYANYKKIPTLTKVDISTRKEMPLLIASSFGGADCGMVDSSLSVLRFRNKTGMEFSYIKPATFQMGSPPDETSRRGDEFQHPVTLTKGYYLQTTEVTQGQWKKIMGTEPWKGQRNVREGDNYPASYVSWDDAQRFTNKLNGKEGSTRYRLPTEAEWEYACRAKMISAYYWGSRMDKTICWHDENANRTKEAFPHEVGRKLPNAWGLYDMSGNVWEWCLDWYDNGYYWKSSAKDPKGPRSATQRKVRRGGSWSDPPADCRSASRGKAAKDNASSIAGFRVLYESDN